MSVSSKGGRVDVIQIDGYFSRFVINSYEFIHHRIRYATQTFDWRLSDWRCPSVCCDKIVTMRIVRSMITFQKKVLQLSKVFRNHFV